MKIGFTGSRVLTQLNAEMLLELAKIADEKGTIIHGGAIGADELVDEFAYSIGINREVIRPISMSNKIDYLYRNVEIVAKADKILAFWDGKSRGTKFTIDYAKARGKEVKVVMF